MLKIKRISSKVTTRLLLVLVFSACLFWTIAAAEPTATQPAEKITKRSADAVQVKLDQPDVIGLPCGSGELMDPGTICLHGRVLVERDGQLTALNNIQIDVSYGDKTATAFTFIHAGDGEPTYGLDINSIEPAFLEPVTVTVDISGTLVQRQVTVYPNFQTHNQAYDIIVPDLNAFDSQILWGYVIDYSAGGPVAGAIVTASYGSPLVSVAVTTKEAEQDGYPVYSFLAADLPGIRSGDEVRLTAEYGGEQITNLVVLDGDDPVQQNLLTGWKCNDYDPFPRNGGVVGFPRNGGVVGFPGFPDAICVWGYGLSNGVPTETVKIEIEVDGQFFHGTTKQFPGETLPRYGIALPNASELINKPMTVTALFNGLAEQVFTTVAAEDSPIQRADLNIIGVEALRNAVNPSYIIDYVWHEDSFWAVTNGGVVQWDPSNLSGYNLITPDNSDLAQFRNQKIQKDSRGNLFVTYANGPIKGIQKFEGESREWVDVDPANQTTSDFVDIQDQDQVWFFEMTESASTFYRFDPISEFWEAHSAEGIVSPTDTILDFQTDQNGDTWFLLYQSNRLIHYSNATHSWRTLNLGFDGDVTNSVPKILVSTNNKLYFINSLDGFMEYDTQTESIINYRVDNSALSSNQVVDFSMKQNGQLYILTADNVQRFDPSTGVWQNVFNPSSVFNYKTLEGIYVDPEDRVWLIGSEDEDTLFVWYEDNDFATVRIDDRGPIDAFASDIVEQNNGKVLFGTKRGISVYDAISGLWDSYTSHNSSLPVGDVENIAITPDGSIWAVVWHQAEDNPAQVTSFLWRYHPTTDSTTIYQTDSSHLKGRLFTVDWFDSCDCLLIGSKNGISKYFPGTDQWMSVEVATGFAAKESDVSLTPNGYVWTGPSEGHGIRIFNSDLTFKEDLLNHSDWVLHDLSDVQQFDVVEASDGTIWMSVQIGTIRSHLIELKPDGSLITHTRESLGLPYRIFDLNIDAYDRLWLLSYSEVVVFDPHDHSLQVFEPGYSLTGGLSDYNSFLFGRSNNLWLATTAGATHWNMPIQRADAEVSLEGVSERLDTAIGDLQYTVVVSNAGEIATAIDLRLDIPLSTTVVASNLPQPVEGTEPIEFGVLEPGEVQAYRFTLRPAEGWKVGQKHLVQAFVDGGARESIMSNNKAVVSTKFVAPNQVDLSAVVTAPPTVIPGKSIDLRVTVSNEGTKVAAASIASLQLPDGLSIDEAEQNWPVPPLAVGERYEIVIPVQVAKSLGEGFITIKAEVNVAVGENQITNNRASIRIPVSASLVRTLILVAPERLAEQYGPSTVMNDVYQLAEHIEVDGLVINLESDPAIREAYAQWNTNQSDWTEANRTAEAIQALLQRYLDQYNTVEYIVLVGGDNVLPHYRMADQNETQWQERNYAVQVEGHPAVHAAMMANKLLTDDFYADPNPAVPESVLWTSTDPVFVPDYAIGRLIETPEEISAVIGSFLGHNGVISIDDSLIGGDDFLAGDLVAQQCELFSNSGITVNCANSDLAFAHIFEQTKPSSAWTSFHSNHYSMGLFGESLVAEDLYQLKADNTLMGTIGCHAGLNVSDANLDSDIDLAQGIAFNGGTTIGSTAYTYGSSWGINYTEALMSDFTKRFIQESRQPIGKVLKETKKSYFAQRGWFDPLDAKTITPMTLYGLPMMRFEIPSNRIVATTEAPSQLQTVGESGQIVTMEFPSDSFTEVETSDGSYYEFMGQTLAQFRQPIQPAYHESVPYEKDGEVLKGIVLYATEYQDLSGFDPVINESWVMGAQTQQELIEPAFEKAQWDRDLPVGFTVVDGEDGPEATLSYVPGLFNQDLQIERLFQSISVELLYGDAEARQVPQLRFSEIEQRDGETDFSVGVFGGRDQVERIIIVYEAGQSWESAELQFSVIESAWVGMAPTTVARYRIQVIDKDGNLNDPGWLTGSFGHSTQLPFPIYLPIARK